MQKINVTVNQQQSNVTTRRPKLNLSSNVKVSEVKIRRTKIKVSEEGVCCYTNNASQIEAYTAGEILNGHRLVYLKDSKAYKASNDNPDCFNRIVGMTVNAALEDELVNVKQGKIVNPGWALSPNTLYYLGIDGEITSVPPTSGILQAIGYSYDTDTMYINTNIAIRR